VRYYNQQSAHLLSQSMGAPPLKPRPFGGTGNHLYLLTAT